jgi:hypothetical protein
MNDYDCTAINLAEMTNKVTGRVRGPNKLTTPKKAVVTNVDLVRIYLLFALGQAKHNYLAV